MTFQLQTDKNPFRFHIIFLGTNPIKDNAYHKNEGEYSRDPSHLSRS
jgi:hypothetical protein